MSTETIAKFIQQFGFATLTTTDLNTTHMPLTYHAAEGEHGTLYGHLAKANPHSKALDNQKVLAIFNGPHSYISPTWYASGPAVPTWNYAAVHAYGTARLLSEEQTRNALNELTRQYEPALLDNEVLMPADYQSKLARAIVGIRIELTHIEGKEKLGQHKKHADQQGVLNGLLQNTKHHDAATLAEYMIARNLGIGDV